MVIVRGDHRVNEIKLQNALGAAVPAGPPRGGRGAHRPRRLHRAGGRRRARRARRGRRAGGYVTGRQRGRRAPARRRARPRLRVRARRRAPGGGGRHRRRAADPHRAGDRGRQHLQARHALLGAARRHLPRRGRARSSSSGWAPTASARRGSPPRRSSSSPTSRASPGRARCRPSTSSWSGSARRAARSARLAERLYEELRETGLDVLYDDRDAGPGEKFADAELLGVPAAGDGGPAHAGERRAGGPGAPRPRARASVPLEGAARGAWPSCGGPPVERSARLTFRRLSGPRPLRPAAARRRCAGQPLHPWTIPNAIGFVRLALIPVFLVLALVRDDGTDALPAVIFAVVGWGDYARRDRRARHRPVQPPRRAAGPGGRPAAGDRGRRGVLALRAAPALGAGRARRARAVRGRAGALRHAARHGPQDQLARAARASGR